VKRSRFVVVGVPVRQPLLQTKGGKVIAHQFVVKVQEVLKGELRSGAVIRVNVRGSGQPFVPSPGEADLLVNRSQVLFLGSHPAGRNTTYELVGGREGLFPLNTVEGVVHLGDRWPDDPLARDYGQRPHKWLLSDVRLLAHKATSK
jgi:hypothetical protein